MRYLTLFEALKIAENVTGLDVETIARVSRIELLDSALHAPQTGFGDFELYQDVFSKAAVLGIRIAMNHPLPDGNKRLAWASTRVFLLINDIQIGFAEDEAVEVMLSIASGKVEIEEFAGWLRSRELGN